MTTSRLAENTRTKKMESSVINRSSENIIDTLTDLGELLNQLAAEIAKQEPLYDVPRRIESYYDIPRSALSHYDVPGSSASHYDVPGSSASHYDVPGSSASHYDRPKSLERRPLPPIPVEPSMGDEPIYAKIDRSKPSKGPVTTKPSMYRRPLPPLPIESSMANESIYETIDSFKAPKNSVKIKTSLQQAKVHLLESLRRCLHSLNKIFTVIRHPQSNETMKTLQDTINNDPVLNEKLALSLAEFKFSTLKSSESLQDLIKNLENVIFVLEGRVAVSMKVYKSTEYGEMLGAKLTQPMAEAKLDLSQAKARLAEVKGLEKALALTNAEPTQAPTSVANNRFSLFGKTASTSTAAKIEENVLYESVEVVKGMTRSAS